MSDTLIEGAINRQTAATLALAEAQYRSNAANDDPGLYPETAVRKDYEKWLAVVLDDAGKA